MELPETVFRRLNTLINGRISSCPNSTMMCCIEDTARTTKYELKVNELLCLIVEVASKRRNGME